MDALIAKKQGNKLVPEDFVGNHEIQDEVATLPTVSNETNIKSLLVRLFPENQSASQQVIEKSGESTARTYLEESGGKILRAIKVYDIDDECHEHLYELLSCLYSKREIDRKLGATQQSGEVINIGFSEIEIASFWKIDNTEKAERFVIVFKGAAGQVVESIIESTSDINTTLSVVASAFALLHEKTKLEGYTHESSDATALVYINNLLTNTPSSSNSDTKFPSLKKRLKIQYHITVQIGPSFTETGTLETLFMMKRTNLLHLSITKKSLNRYLAAQIQCEILDVL